MTQRTGKQRNATLERLSVLVGEWRMEAIVDGQAVAAGITTFDWMDGADLLVQHVDADPTDNPPEQWLRNAPFPVTTVIGLDDQGETFTMLYADGRAVVRVYQMTLADGVWTQWRDAPGFNQRFRATLDPAGTTMTGYWEGSSDGTTWTKDFDVRYTKV